MIQKCIYNTSFINYYMKNNFQFFKAMNISSILNFGYVPAKDYYGFRVPKDRISSLVVSIGELCDLTSLVTKLHYFYFI